MVDDEESLVAVTSEVLASSAMSPWGFPIAERRSAEFESAPDRFDAAITDEVIPG